jgi:hypothetical protein
LHIAYTKYSDSTIRKWQQVWASIFEMIYNDDYVIESIVTRPGTLQFVEDCVYNDNSESSHMNFYKRQIPENWYALTFDYVWKYYSKKYPQDTLYVITDLKRLHVPRCLFESVGVSQLFNDCFPNCVVTFWKEDN